MNRGYIYHCTRCRSRTELDTDWNGRLVERLNHVCTCPPIVYQPEVPTMQNQCVDCQAPIKKSARRCVLCGENERRRKRREEQAKLEEQRKVERKLALQRCQCGNRVQHKRARWCPECKLKMGGMSERRRKLMRQGELAA